MKVTYIYHSCFLLEFDKCYLLFDYYKGSLPELDKNKRIYVFSSHSHGDHFEPKIIDMLSGYDAKYIFSDDIKHKADISVHGGGTYSIDNIEIKTLRSTDLGVAFIVRCEGKVIYHAGDLNDWVWQEESPDYNRKMTEMYRKEIDKINFPIDIAFVPLDSRQEDWYYRGMKYFVENVEAKTVFPMHFWEDFGLSKKFNALDINKKIVEIEKNNTTWELEV